MNNLNYCVDCRRISNFTEGCTYCQSQNIKELTKRTPVNVIGSKIKGRVYNTKNDMVNILYTDEAQNKSIKQYNAKDLQKIL